MSKYDIIFSDKKKDKKEEIIKSYYFDGEDELIKVFPNFNRINIIVGSNNSGKSRFMRFLMSQDSFLGIKEINNFKTNIEDYNLNVNVINSKVDDFIHKINTRRSIDYTGGKDLQGKQANIYGTNRLRLLSIEHGESMVEFIKDNNLKIKQLSPLVERNEIADYDRITYSTFKNYDKDIKRYYIPTLRTAHSLFTMNESNYKKIEQDIYRDTLNKYYDLHKMNIDVFTGIHLHREILNTRNSKREVRQSFEKFEKFISKNFFSGKQIDIVAEFNKDENEKGFNHSEVISVHIEGEKNTRYLYELGDGIQAIIILMYKIFMAEPNSIIFIDEPELNLHPGMQRLFLEQIYSNKDLEEKKLTYVISTHSNHFLDLTLEKTDVSIYAFSPKHQDNNDKEFIIKNVNAGDNQILKHLGVNNSSVFMANCSIWVEGVSDRNYIKAFLNSYLSYLNTKTAKKHVLKEDIDFAFFEYAGSNIDHYIFDSEYAITETDAIVKDIKALALSNRIFLLADSDISSKGSTKGKKLIVLEKSKTDNFIPKIIWNIREIENLLTNEIWEKVLISLCNKNLIKDHKADIVSKINLALQDIKYSKYKKKYIGYFLNDIRNKVGMIGGQYVINESTYEVKKGNEFGTLKNKRELSELVLELEFSWDILSSNIDIKKLTIEIYEFIKKGFS